MTHLNKAVSRLTLSTLGSQFGADRNRRLAVTLIPGNGKDVPDTLELRPERTRRPERIALDDLYSIMVRARINAKKMTKLREKLEAKKRKREAARSRRIIRGGAIS